jgi:hypothetical protein
MSIIKFSSKMELPITSVRGYQFKELTITEESAGEIAKIFGIPYGRPRSPKGSPSWIPPEKGVLIEKSELGYVLRKGQKCLFEAKASGAIEYKDLSTFQIDLGKSVGFSDAEAVDIAKKNIRQLDLIPLNESRLMKVKHLTKGSSNLTNGEVISRIVNVSVIFQRMVDKIPVVGPGGKLAVVLDANGAMCAVHRVWRDIASEESREMKLRPATFARDSLTDRFEKFNMTVEVTKEEFGYWEMGPYDSQKYLQPVFALQFDNMGPLGSTKRKGLHVVPAAKNPMPGLEFKKGVWEVQPPRH